MNDRKRTAFLNSLRIMVALSAGIRVLRVSGDAAVSQYSASRTEALPG
jgi:hypothetical protein